MSIGALVFAVTEAFRLVGLLLPLELGAYDWFLRLRIARDPMPSPIVLVRIQEEDIRHFGHPLCDRLLARAVDLLLRGGARSIGVDIYRDVPVPICSGSQRDAPAVAGEELREIVARSNRVFMVMKFAEDDRRRTPPPPWLQSSQVAFSDLPPDQGGMIRRSLLYLWDGPVAYSSLALQIALRYLRDEGLVLGPDASDPRHLVRVGHTTLPPFRANEGPYVVADDRGYQFLLDFRQSPRSFTSISLGDLLLDPAASEAVRDKVVLLGTTAPSVKDYFYTPYSAKLPGDGAMYGIEVHGLAASQLLRLARGETRPLQSPTPWAEASWLMVWTVLGVALGWWNRSALATPLIGLAGVATLFGSGYWLFLRDWWIPVVPPALAAASSAGLVGTYRAVLERRERRQVRSLFSRFIGPGVADEIWKRRREFMRQDEKSRPLSRTAVLTTLMCDLEGYVTLSEKLDADLLADWVSDFTKTMAREVELHQGVIEDYAGDGIKADFGFPVPRETEQEIAADARKAVSCALSMAGQIEELNQRWGARGLPATRLRIGICTGPAVFGILGGDHSLKYASLGDTVNTASRLESFHKEEFEADHGLRSWRILVSEGTHQRLGEGFRIRELGLQRLRGKDLRVPIYEVLGPMEAKRSCDEVVQ